MFSPPHSPSLRNATIFWKMSAEQQHVSTVLLSYREKHMNISMKSFDFGLKNQNVCRVFMKYYENVLFADALQQSWREKADTFPIRRTAEKYIPGSLSAAVTGKREIAPQNKFAKKHPFISNMISEKSMRIVESVELVTCFRMTHET